MLRFVVLLLTFAAVTIAEEQLPEICRTYPKGAFFSCCEVPRLVAEVDWKRCADTNKEAEEETEAPPASIPHHKHERGKQFRHFMGKCYGDCVFDDAGLLKDGDLDYDALKELGLSKVEGNATWTPVMEEALTNCTEAMGTISEARASVCKTKADMFVMCMSASLFKNCPAEMWKNEEKCDDAKEFFTVCPEILRKSKDEPVDAST